MNKGCEQTKKGTSKRQRASPKREKGVVQEISDPQETRSPNVLDPRLGMEAHPSRKKSLSENLKVLFSFYNIVNHLKNFSNLWSPGRQLVSQFATKFSLNHVNSQN